MLMSFRLFIMAVCTSLIFVSTISVGGTTEDYFRASVPVKSQKRLERKSATEDALLKVLVRMSGSVELQYDDRVLQILNRASSYVEQFQYEALSSAELKEQGYRERLTVNFSASGVRKILNSVQMPFWSVNRPNTLIWLVEDNLEFGKQLLSQSSDAPIVQSLTLAAKARGLPLSFPVLDLDDRLAVSADDVWAVNEAAIIEASARYGADVILVGRYSQTSRGEVWSIWQFFHAGQTLSYDSRVVLDEPANVEKLGSDALYPLADFLADRYAIQSGGEERDRFVVKVIGVHDFSVYRESLDYLEGLAAVSSLHIAAVKDDSLLLYLESEASIEKLMSVINLDKKLTPIQSENDQVPVWQRAPRGSLDDPIQFRWSS